MKLLLTFFASILLSSSLSAQLILNVDPATKEYFVSGSATGVPAGEEDFGFTLFWDNQQEYDGGYVDFLSGAAFDLQGNSAFNWTMFLHGNGNVNGALRLGSADAFTLTGNPEVRHDYSSWSPAVIAELEGKATSGEFLAVTDGSPAFAMQFAVVPEPSTYALLGFSGVILMLVRRFWHS